MSRTLQRCAEAATRFLMAEGGMDAEEARREARILLRHSLRLPDHAFLTERQRPVSLSDFRRFAVLARRRASGEPFAYLTGRQEFFSLELTVDPSVLIPRPETEELVELILNELPTDRKREGLRLLDVGTGSGNIAAALAMALPGARITATDFSDAALEVARRNFLDLQLDRRIRLIYSDLMAALPADREAFDIIVSNPPYVLREEYDALEVELHHEPRMALVVDHPEEFYTRFFAQTMALLTPGGRLYLESSPMLLGRLHDMAVQAGLAQVAIRRDLSHRDRFLTARRP